MFLGQFLTTLAVNDLKQQIERACAHFVGGLGDGSEARAEVSIPDVVVKANNTQLTRHNDLVFVDAL